MKVTIRLLMTALGLLIVSYYSYSNSATHFFLERKLDETENLNRKASKPLSGWNVKYTSHIKPLIQAKCLTGGCHAPGGSATGYLTTYSEVVLKADLPLGNGSLRPSILSFGKTPMPPSAYPQLTKSEMLQFIYWLNNGAPQ